MQVSLLSVLMAFNVPQHIRGGQKISAMNVDLISILIPNTKGNLSSQTVSQRQEDHTAVRITNQLKASDRAVK